MKKVLLAYATMEGQTEKIARVIRDHLVAGGADVSLVNVANSHEAAALDIAAFDLLVFGCSIHVGRIEKEMLAFINGHAAGIAGKPRALFVVLMAAASTNPAAREKSLRDVRAYLAKQLHVEFADPEMIAGALMYTRYGWFTKWVMKRISAREGGSIDTTRDHEYTDWEQVVAYAGTLLARNS